MSKFKSLLAAALVAVPLFAFQAQAENDPKLYAVEVSAVVQPVPTRITLNWPADPNASSYSISRRTSKTASWTPITSLPGTAVSFYDPNVAASTAYEYQILKTTTVGYIGSGYITAGDQIGFTENRGKVLLLVDSTYTTVLAPELARLQQDLIGDGWTVIRKDVARTATVPSVKNLIKTEYNADPSNVKAVFLFGHIPVPYSGNFNPDGHPDHQGAWPADAYYGDMDGVWTDSSVNNSVAQRPENKNVPGDGKFDQSDLPSEVELAVGRVDLWNMTCFANKTPSRSDVDLHRQYLNKDNNFRHGKLPLPRRGLICDNFGERNGEAFAASGWRNFAPFFGAANVSSTPAWTYFSTLATDGYLWSYGTGGGSYTSCNGIGWSDNFATTDIKTVFTMFLGSYFGDWDTESSFLRAPLGSSSYTLTTSWAGRPHWFYHGMALGEPIAYSTLASQNNRNGGSYLKQNYGTRQVHIALLGDPTLRMHPVIPPSSFAAVAGTSGMNLSWAASTDTVRGYNVYRASSPNGPFTKLNTSFITGTTFPDPNGTTAHTYMVRAIKLEQSGSGSYFNLSQGIFAENTSGGSTTGGSTGTTTGSTTGTTPPTLNVPTSVLATAVSGTQINVSWTDSSTTEAGFKVFRKNGNGAYSQIAWTGANLTSFQDSGLASGTIYTYRVLATDGTNDSAASVEAIAMTLSAPGGNSATFISADTTTSGSWKGRFGSKGFSLPYDDTVLPANVTMSVAGKNDYCWAYNIGDLQALQKNRVADRLAACWYSSTSFTLDLALGATATKVSFYSLDWDQGYRGQTIEIINGDTGAVLDTRTVTAFTNGIYHTWNLQGRIKVRFTRTAGYNAVLSGVFFD